MKNSSKKRRFKKNKSVNSELKPFMSVLILISIMITFVFLKMEVRRRGYQVLKLSHTYKVKSERRRLREMQLAKLTRSDRIEKYAQNRLALKKASKGQVVQLAGQHIALSH